MDKCIDSRECFAKARSRYDLYNCLALNSTYRCDGACPFCKPVRLVTDGKSYPDERTYYLRKTMGLL